MKITAIKGIPVEGNLIVKVETDQGIYGVGEAGMAPPIPATMKALGYYAEWIVGRDPDDIEGIWQELFRYTRRKEGIVLISAVSGIDATCKNAQSAVDAGFQMVRFQLDDPEGEDGFDDGRAIRYTVQLADEVRRAVGDSIDMSIDVHQRLTPARAVDFCRAVEPAGLLFVEDPTRTEDPCVYRQLRQRVSTALATGENLYSKWQFRPLIEEELTDYLRIDLALNGGITEARKVAAMGEAHYLDVVPHCARGPLLEQVTLHFCIATTNIACQEHTGGPEWWTDILPGLADFSRGSATPPERPGLGVEFNEAEAKKHPFVQREMPHWRKRDGSVQDW